MLVDMQSVKRTVAEVVGLFICAGAREPMQACNQVRAIAGRGLEGDRYALGQGSYSRMPRPVARHVSLISRAAMEAANKQLTQRGLVPFTPAETRRNIVVEGTDVYTLLGREFVVGAVRLRGSDITRPCPVPSEVTGKIGFKEAYDGRGGILAEVLSDGLISIGDGLVVAEPPL